MNLKIILLKFLLHPPGANDWVKSFAYVNHLHFSPQVLSQIGRVIGATEVKVGNNKVSVEQLQIHVITGISVSTSADVELPGTLVARVARQSQLTRKYQVSVRT